MQESLDDLNIQNGKKRCLTNGVSICVTSLICFTLIFANYSYVYRDAAIPQLTYKMQRGVYKGLYTLGNRGAALIFLEDEIKRKTSASDSILFMDLAPEAYLMTDAIHCTPSTWDITLYTYKFNDDYLLREYFNITGNQPSKIIYIETEKRDEYMSIETPNHLFNKFVTEDYILAYSNDAPMFRMLVYQHT